VLGFPRPPKNRNTAPAIGLEPKSFHVHLAFGEGPCLIESSGCMNLVAAQGIALQFRLNTKGEESLEVILSERVFDTIRFSSF